MAAIADRASAGPALAGRRGMTGVLVVVRPAALELGIELGEIPPVARGASVRVELRERNHLVTREAAVEIGVPAQLAELAVVHHVEAGAFLCLHDIGNGAAELVRKSRVRRAAVRMLFHCRCDALGPLEPSRMGRQNPFEASLHDPVSRNEALPTLVLYFAVLCRRDISVSSTVHRTIATRAHPLKRAAASDTCRVAQLERCPRQMWAAREAGAATRSFAAHQPQSDDCGFPPPQNAAGNLCPKPGRQAALDVCIVAARSA